MAADDRALIVIDVQNDFCPGGALAVAEGDLVVAAINRVAGAFPVKVLTQDWHPAHHRSFAANHPDAEPFSSVEMHYGPQVLWPVHCVQGSVGAEFHPDLETDAADLILRKGFRAGIDSYSAFFENDRRTPTGLAGYLHERGVRRLWLAGLATDFCVAYSAIDAAGAGFEVTVLEDATRAIDLDGSLAAAMREMAGRGVTFARADDMPAG
ncbi:MAG: bifunctional nicotinamidase/pyrazinamidase [Amaricoccus sp.]